MHCTVDKCNRIVGISGLCATHQIDREHKPTNNYIPSPPKVKKYCSVDGCYLLAKVNELCTTHYDKKRRYGDPSYTRKKSLNGKYLGFDEYNIWVGMRSRCSNPNNKYYKHYGGRGIKVCARWIDNVENFINDMGERPSSRHTIERKDNNGNYEPSNCIWATYSVQASNRRNNVARPGVNKYGKRWRARMMINGITVLNKTYDYYKAACNARAKAEKKYRKV